MVISAAFSCYLPLDGKVSLKTKLFIIPIVALSALDANFSQDTLDRYCSRPIERKGSLIEDHEFFDWNVFAVFAGTKHESQRMPAAGKKKPSISSPAKKIDIRGTILVRLGRASISLLDSITSTSLICHILVVEAI